MNPDFVVKLGGSLLSDKEKTRRFLNKFEAVDATCVFTVGSGPLGDAFNELTATLGIDLPFGAAVESWSHIQSVNARLVAAFHKAVCVCSSLDQVEEATNAGRRPIVDASGFSGQFMSLSREHQMSDVRSALVAGLLGCRQLVVFTDVEGIFDADPRNHADAIRVPVLDTQHVLLRSRTSVDEGLSQVLEAEQIVAYVTGVDSFLESQESFTAYLDHHASQIKPMTPVQTADITRPTSRQVCL